LLLGLLLLHLLIWLLLLLQLSFLQWQLLCLYPKVYRWLLELRLHLHLLLLVLLLLSLLLLACLLLLLLLMGRATGLGAHLVLFHPCGYTLLLLLRPPHVSWASAALSIDSGVVAELVHVQKGLHIRDVGG
jgi:hypothetical protein